MNQQNVGQQCFLWDLDGEIGAENAVRFLQLFVDALDLQGLGFTHTVPAATGRPPYAAQDLLALYL